MTALLQHPYAAFIHKIEKPNRYLGAEFGTTKKDWSSVKARICLAFPDIYDIGMSHLGYRILYKLLNDDSQTLAERCYTPWLDMQQALHDHGKLLVSLETARPLCDFDVVGFSLQFELTYTNILSMLDLGGIPLRSEHRGDADPLVIAGGPVATHMEPMAPFFDAVLIGDGEEATREIALDWVDSRGLPREERLVRLAKIPGVYVPSLYTTEESTDTGLEVVKGPKRADLPFPIERRLVEDLGQFPFPDDGPVGGPEAIFDRMSIEVARGCTEGCRFCQAGMIYRPVRERDPQEVVDTVMRALDNSGQDEVSLTALSTADVSCISPLIKSLVEKTAPERVSLGVASLRAYGLAKELLDDMRKVRASGLTFAPEAGTQRMRDVINKNVTEEQLLETAERVFSRGFSKMKLYFIIGLPTEQDEDVLGIVEVGKNALEVGKRVGKRPSVTVSVSTHVPKPHTPFQWCAMDSLAEVKRKQQLLKNAARGFKNLKLRMHDASASVLEGVLARGDRRLAPMIEWAYQKGARFDSWDEQLKLDVWHEAFERFGVELNDYLSTWPTSARLPWDHFDIGLEDGFLAREYRKAVANRLSPPCGKARGMFIHHDNVGSAERDARKLVCYDCGVACDLTQMRQERLVSLRKMGAFEQRPARVPLPALSKSSRPESLRPSQIGAAERWRLKFEKTGPFALLGHLDLIRELPRVARRAGVRTVYSEGFHPKPEMSFAPALAVGVASLGELVDMRLSGAPAPSELLQRLNAVAPPGLRFVEASRLGPNDKALSRFVRRAHYVLGISRSVLSERGGEDWLAERLREFTSASEVLVRREVRGLGRQINVRAKLLLVRRGGQQAEQVLEAAGVVGDLVPLEVLLDLDPAGTARLSEIAEALLGDTQFPMVVIRSKLEAAPEAPVAKPAQAMAAGGL